MARLFYNPNKQVVPERTSVYRWNGPILMAELAENLQHEFDRKVTK